MNKTLELLDKAIEMAWHQKEIHDQLVLCRAEAAKLYQALKDLVDFDISQEPELDSLDAALGPGQLSRMNEAWRMAGRAIGGRDMARFYGDKP